MMSMPMLDRANDLLERADKLDDAGLLGQGAQLAEHVERAGHGLMPASSIVCHLPLNVTCGSAHSACMTSTCSSERRAARRLRPVVSPPAPPAAIGSFRINPLNR